jgi:hypothetical protein
MIAAAACVTLLVSGVGAFQGGDTLLSKKDSFADNDKGYQPGKEVDKLKEPFAKEFFMAITDAPHKVYKLRLKKGDKVEIQMKSTDVDSVVVVENSKNVVLAFNDDDPSGGTLNSRLVWTAPENDEYNIIATNLRKKKSGNYELTVTKAK